LRVQEVNLNRACLPRLGSKAGTPHPSRYRAPAPLNLTPHPSRYLLLEDGSDVVVALDAQVVDPEPVRVPQVEEPPHLSMEREFFIDNLLVRIHFIIVMIRWTGLAPWEIESR